jgi:hypothetical protein
MKLAKMQKTYCPLCKNRIKCQLNVKEKDGWRERTMKEQIKWYGTGSMTSENKLWSLKQRIDEPDFCCAVLSEIIKVRFEIKVENLRKEIEGLEVDKLRLAKQIDKCEKLICNTLLQEQKEVVKV